MNITATATIVIVPDNPLDMDAVYLVMKSRVPEHGQIERDDVNNKITISFSSVETVE